MRNSTLRYYKKVVSQTHDRYSELKEKSNKLEQTLNTLKSQGMNTLNSRDYKLAKNEKILIDGNIDINATIHKTVSIILNEQSLI